MIPLLHDFTGETVLVVGGGPVGARKARRFAAEAEVVVVSPEFADREFGAAQLVRAAPSPEEFHTWVSRIEPALVVTATDDEELNAAAAEAARAAGALVNRADGGGESESEQSGDEVVVPATVRDDPVTVAIATGGNSPALSKHLREEFEREFAGAGAMAELTGTLREELKETNMSPQERRDAVRTVVRADEVWKALDSGRSKARQVAEDVIGYHPGDMS
jgi:precorrin-2 dehydrogenase/sirohydrochlorin ferrochelatase